MPWSSDVRWIVLYKRLVLGHTHEAVTGSFDGIGPQKHCQNDIIARFLETGSVETHQGRPAGPRRNQQVMDAERDLQLLGMVLDRPEATLREHCLTFLVAHGLTVHVSSICRAMARMGLCRQRLQHFALRRDADKARAFWLEMMTFYTMEDMLVLDETAKDRRDMRRSFGWGARGCPPFATDSFPTRGGRTSALCVLSSQRFEGWAYTSGTYNAERFDEAVRAMLLTPRAPGQPRLVDRFKVVLIDNASIHKNFEAMVGPHAQVRFIPPYCYHLSPLDNGAFGWVCGYLQTHHLRLGQGSIEAALDEAFSNMPPEVARYCFHNCNYYSAW